MTLLQLRDQTPARPRSLSRALYWIEPEDGEWFIHFDGANYGPYKNEREAMLFAVDAANKLSEQGKGTQVLVMDKNNEIRRTWTSGRDSYPARI